MATKHTIKYDVDEYVYLIHQNKLVSGKIIRPQLSNNSLLYHIKVKDIITCRNESEICNNIDGLFKSLKEEYENNLEF